MEDGRKFAEEISLCVLQVMHAENIECTIKVVFARPRSSSSAAGVDTVEVNLACGFTTSTAKQQAQSVLEVLFKHKGWRFFAAHEHKHEMAIFMTGKFAFEICKSN